MNNYHTSVLLTQSIEGLNIQPDGVYVDVTFGGGGHSREILNHLSEKGKLYAFDQDKDALENEINDPRFTLINQNFRYLKRFLRFYGVSKVDGILGDFGVSSHQFDEPARGFSTRFVSDLDMRMNQDDPKSAYTILNNYEDSELKNARQIAKAIVEYRQEKEIKTSGELQQILKKWLPKFKENKVLAQIFQGIRIEVNDEINVLKDFLTQTSEVLKVGGRLSLISYHSLEDRLVKRFIRDGKFSGEAEKDMFGRTQVPFKKVGNLIVPSQEEIERNNRARSAKLRRAEKIE